MPAWLARWFERHRHPASRVLHLIGIPLTIAAAALAVAQSARSQWELLWQPASLLALGYLLQWIGHTYFEKNEVGEWILIKGVIKRFKKR